MHEDRPHTQASVLLDPYVQEEPLSLAQLQDFLRHPVRHFFSQRLKVFFESAQAPLEDEEPFVLDALQRYSLSDSLLEAALSHPDQPEQALQLQAQRLQHSGLLPMAGFGECLQRELIEPLPDLVQRYQQLLALWPTPNTSALPVSLQLNGVSLEGWLSGLHQRADGGLLSVTTIPNSIGSIKTRKWHRLTRPWINHLVACACGLPMTTGLVASDDTLLLAPLDENAALKILGDLLQAWQSGMRQPLPVAVKTAFAWLGQTDPVKAQAAARKAYEGDGLTSEGERRESPALARQFADYNALIADETFEAWCDALYRPLLEASWRSVTREESPA
ncbi:RecBCD enzyme subunit RecC [compost metagenome]